MKVIRVADAQVQPAWGQVVALEQCFAPMIARLEQAAQTDPDAYRRKVTAAGLFGYAVLLGLLVLLIGLTLLMVWILFSARTGILVVAQLGLVLGLTSYALIRALSVPRLPPDGLLLDRPDAPVLFECLDRLRTITNGPRIHEVRITDQMNAAVTQEARFLLFGSHNTLFLGLPLLIAMRKQEVETVIAHELGHFVGLHARSSGFAYRIRLRWAQVSERLTSGVVANMLRRFFEWYGPWFAAYSFVLARQHEYEADSISAKVVGEAVAAQALTRIVIQSERMSAAWQDVWNGCVESEEPPSSPYSRLSAAFALDDPKDRDVLHRALKAKADIDDTHPTLELRLAALDQPTDAPPAIGTSAAVELLGSELDTVQDRFDAEWHSWADSVWKESFSRRKADIAEREMLECKVTAGEATEAEHFKFASLVETIDGASPAIEAYTKVLERFPYAYGARFRRGDVLLELGDDVGMEDLLAAAEGDRDFKPYAYRRIVEYLTSAGRHEDAGGYAALLEEAEAAEERAEGERSSIDQLARLRPLEIDLQQRLVDLVTPVAGVSRLRACLRDLDHSDVQQIVFIFKVTKGANSAAVLDLLIEAITPAEYVFGIEEGRESEWLMWRIEALANNEIVA